MEHNYLFFGEKGSMLKKLFSLVVISLTCFSLDASITEIKDLSPFRESVELLDEDAIVLVDIDYTMIAPSDAALLPCGSHLWRQYLHSLDLKRREFLQSIIALETEEKLMDVTFLEIIKQLQEKNIPVFGFTALETGRYGKIENLEDWRLTVLKQLGVGFSSSLNKQNFVQLDTLPQYNGNYPLFKNGVLFANRRPKGEVFAAFVSLLERKPKRVVLIDDALKYLKSVEQAAQELGIEFIGFHYRAAESMQSGFDEQMARFQFQYLLDHEQWLTDKKAPIISQGNFSN